MSRKSQSALKLNRGFLKKTALWQILSVQVLLFALVFNVQFVFAAENSSFVLSALIDEALINNPELKSLKEKTAAYEQRPSQARALDDPMLRFSIANLPVDTFRFDQEAMTQKQISIMQKLPFPGKRELKGDIAGKEFEVAEKEYDEKKNNIVKQVKIIYYNLLFLNRSLEITEGTRNMLSQFIKTAETNYSVGKGGQQEVLKAKIELSKIIRRIISLNQQRETVKAKLNTVLNRPLQTEVLISGELTHKTLSYSLEELSIMAEQSRPALASMGKMVERSHLAVNLAEREYYPDMDFGVTYGQRDDIETADRPDFFSASVTVNIPLWFKTKESRKVSEETANERRSVEQYNALKNSIYLRLKELTSTIEMNRQEIELLVTALIPQSELSLESAIAAYKVNRSDLMTLVNNQISLYNYRLEYYKAVADHEINLADLEETVGKRLF